MRLSVTTDAAIPGRNEDAAGVLGDVAVVLDGAGVPSRFRAGCHHSVAWYSHTLAAHLLQRAQDPSTALRDALAAAIAEVRSLHEHECELEAGGPSATVVAVRRTAEHLEHLVLSDSSLLLQRRDGPVERLTDARVDDVARAETSPEAIEARRNRPGGFWVARHEPEAAAEARVGQVPLAELRSAHLVSDGITRTIDLMHSHTADSLVTALTSDPGEVLAQLRDRERSLDARQRPRKPHDDATIVTLLL